MNKFIESFNETVKEVEVYLSIARDSDLQRDAILTVENLIEEVSKEKSQAINKQNEDYANQLLGCECVCEMLVAELEMWILLKEESPNEAWDRLIDAQMSSANAARAHDGFLHHEEHHRRLVAIEKLVFPPQVFISSGMVVHKQECSICGEDYEQCEHLAGKPYMGEFCYIIGREPELDDVPVVEDPADKRCRVRNFSVDGGTRDRMTWRIEYDQNGT
jgi:hypothetical protein